MMSNFSQEKRPNLVVLLPSVLCLLIFGGGGERVSLKCPLFLNGRAGGLVSLTTQITCEFIKAELTALNYKIVCMYLPV